jgi:Immunity protein Imm1
MIKMTISDMKTTRNVLSVTELHQMLSVRYDGGVNSFEIAPIGQDAPHLTVVIRRDIATLHYDSAENAGFAPYNPENGLDPDGFTTLYYGMPNAIQETWNPQIVTTSEALRAAEEFATTEGRLPTSIRWTEL